MASSPDVERAGERVEELLAELQERADADTVRLVEELVRVLLTLYGEALGRVLDLAGDGPTLSRLSADPLLSALLVLHDLHPEPAEVRIERALETIRPHLGSHAGGVELVGIDGAGVVHLRLEGTCHGCASSAATVRGAVETAVLSAAPEAVAVEVEGMVGEGAPGFVPVESVGLHCPTGLKVEVVR